MCSEALVAAVCVRLFSDAPARFDTLRRVGVFIAGAVLVAPFVSSFPAAAAVSGLLHGTVLARVADPIFLERPDGAHAGAGHRDGHHLAIGQGRSTTFRRCIEAALLAVATVTVSVVVMAEPIHGASAIPGAPYTRAGAVPPIHPVGSRALRTRGHESLAAVPTAAGGGPTDPWPPVSRVAATSRRRDRHSDTHERRRHSARVPGGRLRRAATGQRGVDGSATV